MQTLIARLTMFVMVILIFTGCVRQRQETRKPQILPPAAAKTFESSYYFYAEAQLARKKGDLDRVVELLNRASSLDPESRYLKKELADIYLQQKNHLFQQKNPLQAILC